MMDILLSLNTTSYLRNKDTTFLNQNIKPA